MLNPPRLVAVDTNVALDFAKGIDDVCDAIATIRARVVGVELLLPPTVVEELAHAVLHSPESDVRAAATKMLRQHRSFGRFDLIAPVIATPREIVKKFFR